MNGHVDFGARVWTISETTARRLWALVSALRLLAAAIAFVLGFVGEFRGAGFLSPWEVGVPVLAYAVVVPVTQWRAGRLLPSLNGAIADCCVGLTSVGLSGGWQSPYFLILLPSIVAATLALPVPLSLVISVGISALYGAVAVVAQSNWADGSMVDILTDNLAILFATALVTSTLHAQWRTELQHRRQEQQLTRRLAMLNRILSETFPVSLDQSSTLRTVAELTREAVESAVAGVLMAGNGAWRLWSTGGERDGVTVAAPRADLAALVGPADAVAVPDVPASPFADPLWQDLAVQSLLIARFQVSEESWGYVFAGDRQPRSFAPDEQRLLSAIGRVVSFAMRNAALYDVEREQVQRLREVERLKTDFFSNVSHDLLTPLGALTTATGLLVSDQKSQLSPLSASLLENIGRNAERLEVMVKDLLEISRIQSGRVRLSRSLLDPKALAQEAAEMVAPLLRAKGQRLTFNAADGLPAIWADHDRLCRVLVNLLQNATKYTPNGGTITFCVDGEPDAVRFSVLDTGPGIPPELRERVFERFYRPEGGEDRSGSGLGLSIARTLAEMHGGTIRVDDHDGLGACFVVTIPVGEADREDPDC
jgi:signal transduction histidine kinase